MLIALITVPSITKLFS